MFSIPVRNWLSDLKRLNRSMRDCSSESIPNTSFKDPEEALACLISEP